MSKMEMVKISEIIIPHREHRFNTKLSDVEDLAASINRIGLIEPVVIAIVDGNKNLLAGHRRLRACKDLGMEEIPAKIEELTVKEQTELTFAENFFRKDLSPIELACAIQECSQIRGMNNEEIAKAFHRSENWVKRKVEILSWPEDVLEAIHSGLLSESAASNLALVTEETYRIFLVNQATESGATARTTAAWLQAWRSSLPQEEAVQAEPIEGPGHVMPAVPQAPCICCSNVFRTDELSHVPACPQCIKRIRELGQTLQRSYN